MLGILLSFLLAGISTLMMRNDDLGERKSIYVDKRIHSIINTKPKCISETLLDSNDLSIRWDALNNLDVCYKKLNNGIYIIKENDEHDWDPKADRTISVLSMSAMIDLAGACEKVLFGAWNNDKRLEHRKVLPKFVWQLMLPFRNQCFGSSESMEEVQIEMSAHSAIGAQLTLGVVESMVRELVGEKKGRAPLLKDMIEALSISDYCKCTPSPVAEEDQGLISTINEGQMLVSVLRGLLLPTGINLRNLLWHGYIPILPQRWFALSIIILHNLGNLDGRKYRSLFQLDKDLSASPKYRSYTLLRNHETTNLFVDHGSYLHESRLDFLGISEKKVVEIQQSFIPRSHYNLLKIAFDIYIDTPVCFAAIISPIIEHSLRLIWCDLNKRQHDKIAHSNSYYVTLDGHGQRDKHEMLLKPTYGKVGEKNKMVQDTFLGGTAFALLTDLFASSGSGPNIRSTICHGSWEKYMLMEIMMLENTEEVKMKKFRSPLKDVLYILLATLHFLQCRCVGPSKQDFAFPSSIETAYRPTFSYAATLYRHINEVIIKLDILWNRLDELENDFDLITTSFADMIISPDRLRSLRREVFDDLFDGYDSWTAEDVFREYELNVCLAGCGAARMLVADVFDALSQSVIKLNSLEQKIYKNIASKRDLKKYSQILSFINIVVGVYSFSSLVGLVSIIEACKRSSNSTNSSSIHKTNISILDMRTVERTRMCVSTFSTYMFKNNDRAIAAVQKFSASKGYKHLMDQLREPSHLSRRKSF